jgi:hypothetical protein
LYSVLPADGVGDFTFSRGSAATRINKDGLIETVASGVSRLNYPLIDGVVNGCPSHLLEPSRLQLIQYSEDFSQWTNSGLTLNSNQAISPDGTNNASEIIGTGYLQEAISLTTSNDYVFSLFWKKNTSNKVKFLVSSTGVDEILEIDTNNLSVISQVGIDSYSIDNYGNGWYRMSMIWNENNTEVSGIRVFADTTDSLSSLYIYGAQLEQGSYPTSYIPNYGTAAGITRVAETANGAGDASTFNSSEGVLFAEISALSNDLSWRGIQLRKIGDGDDQVNIGYNTTTQQVISQVRVAGSLQYNQSFTLQDITTSNKIAILYAPNNFKVYINGILAGTHITTGVTFSANFLNTLEFNFLFGSSNFYGSTKQIQYFDSALNDSDLETLTSWVSFSDMANGQTYSIK